MDSYSRAAVERAMKVQEVILQAMAKEDHVASGISGNPAPATVANVTASPDVRPDIARRKGFRPALRKFVRWPVIGVALLWSLAALTLLAARWIDPPTTAVHIQRHLQAWIHHAPYHERYRFIPLNKISPDLHIESEMCTLFFECMPQCARKLLDSADISERRLVDGKLDNSERRALSSRRCSSS